MNAFSSVGQGCFKCKRCNDAVAGVHNLNAETVCCHGG